MTTVNTEREPRLDDPRRRQLMNRCREARQELVRHAVGARSPVRLRELVERYGGQPRRTPYGVHHDDVAALVEAGAADALLDCSKHDIRRLVGDGVSNHVAAELLSHINRLRSADQALSDHDRQAEREQRQREAQQQDEQRRVEQQQKQHSQTLKRLQKQASDTAERIKRCDNAADMVAELRSLAEQLEGPASRRLLDRRHHQIPDELRRILVECYQIGLVARSFRPSLSDADQQR